MGGRPSRALEPCEDRRTKPDLLFADVAMPDMNSRHSPKQI
jgi:CheY-like chemotaxis protein